MIQLTNGDFEKYNVAADAIKLIEPISDAGKSYHDGCSCHVTIVIGDSVKQRAVMETAEDVRAMVEKETP